MTVLITGILRGCTIVLDQDPGLDDGQRVTVVIEALHPSAPPSDPNPMSSQRPMSAEERAELERVYQDRGCGVECDP